MAMKLMLLAFAFMLVVATKVSSTAVVPPKLAPQYPPKPLPPKPTPVPVAPMHPPTMPAPPLPTPLPHIPKKCAVGCVEYCKGRPGSKRSCQKVCSVCCQKCNVCIPKAGEHKCGGTWDKVMYHGVQVMCP